MKKLLYTLLVLVLIIVAAVAALPYFVSVDFVKARLTEVVKQKTGRDLVIAGEVGFSIWPSLVIEVEDVAFSNASWGKAAQMATIDRLDLEVAMQPLLNKHLDIKKFVLTRPVIALEVNQNGVGNWVFAKPEKISAPPRDAIDAKQGSMPSFKLGDMAIKDGRISYRDARTGKTEVADHLNLNIDYKDFNSPAAVTGDVVYKDKKVNFDTKLDQPLAVITPKGTPAAMNVKMDHATFGFKGQVSSTAATKLSGDLNADIASLSGLMAWAGQSASAPFEKISVAGQAQIGKTAAAFKNAKLVLDDLALAGDFAANLSGAKPQITANIKAPKLDIDKLTAKSSGGEAGAKKKAAAKSKGWSKEKIDFSGLKAADVAATIQADGLVVQGVEIGASQVDVNLKNAILSLVTSEMPMFDGTMKINLDLNAQNPTANLNLDTALNGFAAKKALTQLADFSRLSGRAFSKTKITASGQSVHDFVSSLNGTKTVSFKEGTLEGVDLVALSKNPLAGPLFGNQGAETKFSEISGLFTIKNGVANTQDLQFVSPLLKANGKGTIDLPRQVLNLRIVPRILARTATTETGETVQKGLDVPLLITGALSAPKVTPDLKSIAQDALANPENLKETGKMLEDNAKDLGKNIEKDFKNLKELKNNPEDALKSLFGAP